MILLLPVGLVLGACMLIASIDLLEERIKPYLVGIHSIHPPQKPRIRASGKVKSNERWIN